MIQSQPLRLLLVCATVALPVLLFAALAGGGSAEARARAGERLVIVGFDGGDGRTVQELMDQGELPNFSRLREGGTFAKLGTSVPNESPTSWASLNTGRNPGENGVSGFVKRIIGRSGPIPGFGHIDQSDVRPIEEFENTPMPAWSPWALGGAAGAAIFVLVVIVLAGLLRLRASVSVPLALILGGAGAFAGKEARGLLPSEIQRTTNVNVARNFWDHAADAGVESIVLQAAQAFDMPAPEGARVLSGLGVPDARGGVGDWFIYTDDELLLDRSPDGKGTGTAGTKFRVDWRDGAIHDSIFGPINFYEVDKLEQKLDALKEQLADPKLGYKESIELRDREDQLEDQLEEAEDTRLTLPLVIERNGDGAADVTMGTETQTLQEGEWSDFYHLVFELNPLLKVHAVTRCKLVSLDEPFKLFINTIDIDPSNPPFWQSISEPHGFAPELVQISGGTFETYGWACTTMPFKDGEIAPETLLEDIEFTMKWRERVAYSQLERDDWQMLMAVFSTTDRVQHMMYQYYDELHPLYDEAEASREVTFFGKQVALKDVIPEIYRQADRIVGEIMDRFLGPDDTLLICADHGFQTFRRQVNLNNWLHENGYLALKDGLEKSQANAFQFVDWSNTKAYSMGLGFIYVNERGREPKGIVEKKDKAALIAQIQADLVASRDEETGILPVKESYVVSDIHTMDEAGVDYPNLAPDIVLGFAPTYRISWRTTGGGILLDEEDGAVVPGDIYTDNTSPWSGGHPSVASEDVAGMFFSNRKVQLPEGGPNLLHIAPTALDLLGVPVPAEMDLEPLTFQD